MIEVNQGRQYGGRYQVKHSIASGGMAEVFMARDALLDRPVALKLMHPEYARDQAFIERFRREAKAAASLNDPRIVSIFDWGSDGGTYYIVMEYVQGQTLRDIIATEGPLAPGRAVKIAADVCGGLHLAHQKGIVHRDIKPANIAITTTGQTKVMDFGIARAASDSGQTVTQTGTVVGTASYFSPEQAQGFAVDARSDVYSLGVVLYEMLTGEVPFKGDTAVSIAYKHVTEDPVPPRRLNPNIPPALEAIVMKAMAKNPENRYQSAEQMRNDLVRLVRGERVEATPLLPAQETVAMMDVDRTAVLPAPMGPPAGPRQSRFWPILIGTLLLIAAAIGAAYFFLAGGVGEPSIVVPDVTNKPLEEADRILAAAGLESRVTSRQPSDTVAAGFVISQDPEDGRKVTEGASVQLVISEGKEQVTVPNLINRTQAEASQLLEEAGLDLGQVSREPSDSTEEGRVISQSPRPNSQLDSGDPVDLVVSSGRRTVQVPSLVGASRDSAQARLQEVGLSGQVRQSCDANQPADVVTAQDPAAGTRVNERSAVSFTVNEVAEVPGVEGEDEDDATDTLRDAGFNVEVERVQPNLFNQVIDQSPNGGSEACRGDTVRITVN
ncbi:MAG TPA: Stk1 family PASTA domain-containing Ser/Thr kinase [Actinomycetota bacterium]|nr:Stk1 family PASTA domain-containing Ser/Thr kinase [Actinomycetota bacterium]